MTGDDLKNSKVIELTVLGLWLLIVIVLVLRNKSQDILHNSTNNHIEVETDKKYYIKKVTVIDANTYDLSLKDDIVKRVVACLSVKATSDSKKKIIELLNNSYKPQVLLKQKNADGKWIVDIILNHDDKLINLSEWLIDNNLVYQ